MTNAVIAITQDEMNRLLANAVCDHLRPILQNSRPGHCQRISALSEPVMAQVCAALNADDIDADIVYVLGPRQQPVQTWQVSTTRLIELRNAGRRPLLAFVPPGLKAAAEDSFDISTFAEIDLTHIPAQVRQALRQQIPSDLGAMIDRALNALHVDDEDAIRYFQTVLHNQADGELAGGAIYEIGLIPDFDLYKQSHLVERRIARNQEARRVLLESSESLLVRIHNLGLKANTIQADLYRFLRLRHLADIRSWGRELAADPALRKLCLDHWPFEGEEITDKVLVYVESLDLPPREKGKPIGPDNPHYLDVMRATSVKVEWKTDPKPALVPELAYFRAEIVSSEGDLIVWESKNIPKTSTSKLLKVKDFRDHVEDSLYYFRVRAYSESGELLAQEDPIENVRVLRDRYNPEGKRINESEDVWFWKDADAPPPAEPVRNVTVNSFLDAQLQARFAALDHGDDPFAPNLVPRPDKTGWVTEKGKRAESIYNIVYDAQTRFSLPVSSLLRRIESDTLRKPENLGRWRLNFADGKNPQTVEPTERQFHARSQVPAAFLEARRKLFEAIQGGDQDLLVETVDLTQFEELILDYAAAYHNWLAAVFSDYDNLALIVDEGGRRRSEALYLDIDMLQVEIPNDSPLLDRVYLIAPTHPLRLLWHLQRSLLAKNWLEQALQSENPNTALAPSIRLFLRQGLAPLNLPPYFRPAHEGYPQGIPHFYIEQGPLTPFWSLYVREDVTDRRALYARVRRSLAVSRSSVESGAVAGIDRAVLAQKIERYLIQHPYVQAFKINVFNPGDAAILVDTILRVEKSRLDNKLPALRYELHLFNQGSLLDDVGEAIEELMNPERQVSPEADAFSVPSQNHLFPKLRFYRNHLDDFLQNYELYHAHLSILHDVFPVEVDINPNLDGRSSFLYGLIQDQVTRFGGDEAAEYAWQRQLRPAPCPPMKADEAISSRMALILEQIAQLQASLAATRKVENVNPTLHLKLDLQQKSLLNLVHKISDWVFIIDRNLGLEYFDSSIVQGRPIYLLDYVPEFANIDTDRLFLTTQVSEEITSLIQPVLTERGLDRGEGVEIYFLKLLRSLSGRLALKLLSSPTDVSGVVGLALGRLFLEQFGLLDECILIPLDSHIDLFQQAGRDQPVVDEVSFQRGDLLLVSADSDLRRLKFQIIEVKLRGDLGDMSAYLALRQTIESQLEKTKVSLRSHFDPEFDVVDRVDRPVKTRELISLLMFYLERSKRYGLINSQAGKILEEFINSLDEGYHTTWAGIGLIFDFGTKDLNIDEEHAGLVFYRVGEDYIQRMVDAGLRRDALLEEMPQVPVSITESQQVKEQRLAIIETTDMRRDSRYDEIRVSFQALTGQSRRKPTDVKRNEERGRSLEVKTAHEEPEVEEAETKQPEDAYSEEIKSVPPEKQYTEKQEGFRQSRTHVSKIPEKVQDECSGPTYDVLIGDTVRSRQYGILGKTSGKLLALDLNGTNTISIFGVQGGGKSYTMGTILEMAVQSIPEINCLPKPLAGVVFHYHESQDYPPEFVSMGRPNSNEDDLRILAQEYGARPTALRDVVILTSADKLADRRVEFPGMTIEPIGFSSAELSIKDWRFLMGVGGNQMYMKQINLIMRQLRQEMTLDTLKEEIENSDLSDQQKTVARIRLKFAEQFIDDTRRLSEMLKPGRLIIVDLRDEFIDKDEALGLFVVMLNIFANAGREEGFNKLIIFDEAHKYMDNPDLTTHIVDVIRQMRHQGVSALIASQDPPCLPSAIIELSSLVVLHRFNSPQWLKHVQKSITALSDLTPAQMASLSPGEAFVWATKATERIFSQKAVRVRFRPRLSQHGGGTKTAV